MPMENDKENTESGIDKDNAKKYASGSNESIVPLRDLLNDLADSHAVSVEIDLDSAKDGLLLLTIPTTDFQEGNEILEDVEIVTHADLQFNLEYALSEFGPRSRAFGSMMVLYKSESGLDGNDKSVDVGLQEFEDRLDHLGNRL